MSVGEDGRPDGIWRVEPCGAGRFDLRWRKTLVLRQVPLDRVVHYLLDHDGDPSRLVER